MSPKRDDDDYEEEEGEYEEEEAPRSIFAAMWFRALLIVIVLGVVGVVALPYVLEWWSAKPQVATVKPAQPSPAKPSAPASPPPPKVAEPPAPPAPKPAAPAAPPASPPPPKVAELPAPPAPKPATPVAPEPRPAPALSAEKPAAPAPKPAVTARAGATSKGDYWVQVGAFKGAANAARLTDKLTAEKYPVERATVTRSGVGGGNEVFVEGVAQRDLYDKVKAKGYRADAVKGGAVVRPALPLREAVALSKELATQGMNPKIRPVGGEKGTVYLVRVGGFDDRDKAKAVKAELEGKGMAGFIVRGAPR